MKTLIRSLAFSSLAFLLVLNYTKAEVQCSADGKSYGVKLVACGQKKWNCVDSEVVVSLAGIPKCVPNQEIFMIYAANTGCIELQNVTGTKKACIDWIDPATNLNKREVCYDYYDCITSPTWIGWECLAVTTVPKEGKVDVKCTADCVVGLDD